MYAALLALLFIALSVRTLRLRATLRIAIGDGGDERLLRASRVHGNFAEYVPITLLISLLLELGGAPMPLVHAVGLCLLVGRVVHALGVSRSPEQLPIRVVGMVFTFSALGGGAFGLLALQALRVLASPA
jgi:uncharacterized membrane protein YecN with MAPEG domain